MPARDSAVSSVCEALDTRDLLIALVLSLAALDTWTVVRYFGGKDLGGAATAWHDPVFGNPLAFYLFKIPFYSDLLGLVLGMVVIAGLIYWLAARVWQIRDRVGDWSSVQEINLSELRLGGAIEIRFLRGMGGGISARYGSAILSGTLQHVAGRRTAASWWASTTWIRTSPCRCNGC